MNKTLTVLLSILGVIVLGLLFIGLAVAGSYNSLVGSSTEVDKSWAQVQNVYQRRADLIPNLVQTVQGAANFEKSTLVQVTDARASVGRVQINQDQAPTDAAQLQQFQQAQGQLGNALSRLLVVSENYPALKSNANFLDLQAQLEGSENRIATERRNFNEAVQVYDAKIRTFPTVLFAAMFGFQQKPYFQAEAGAETVPSVKFDFNTPTK